MVVVSATAKQLPLDPDVNVIMTEPPVISEGLGLYVALRVVLFGVNVPVPLELHCAEPVVDVPVNAAFGLLEQTKTLTPAFTTGAGLIVTTIEFDADKQVPFPVVTIVSVAVPAVISAALGE